MIVLDVLGYFNRNKQNSYAALSLSYRYGESILADTCWFPFSSLWQVLRCMYGDFLQAVILLWLDYFSRHLSVPIHSSHAVLLITKFDCLTAWLPPETDLWTAGLILPPVLQCGTCVYEKVSRHLCTWSPLGSMVALAAVDVVQM